MFELLLVRMIWQSKPQHLPCWFSLTRRPLLLHLLIFKGSSPPPPTGLPALKISWAQQAVGNCKLQWQQAQRTSPHCSATRSYHSEDLRNTKQFSTELLSLQRKPVSSSADFHKNLHSKNSLKHWSHNLLLQPPAPFFQRLVTLIWAQIAQHSTSTGL